MRDIDTLRRHRLEGPEAHPLRFVEVIGSLGADGRPAGDLTLRFVGREGEAGALTIDAECRVVEEKSADPVALEALGLAGQHHLVVGALDRVWREAEERDHRREAQARTALLRDAAPDLLAALKVVLWRAEREYHELTEGQCGGFERFAEAVAARAAIAKAEGR